MTSGYDVSPLAMALMFVGDRLTDSYQLHRDNFTRNGSLADLDKMLEKVRI